MDKHRFLSYIFPQTIARFSTTFNKDIRVNEEYGQRKLLVNGSRQSGIYIDGLWRGALKTFGITRDLSVNRILVLGVAGGTVIHLLSKFYPKAQITGVDIDRLMITVGKKYFGLDDLSNLRTVYADAKKFIQIKQTPYDLIIVDLFFGGSIPAFVSSTDFLNDLGKMLTPRGKTVINYLSEGEYVKSSEILNQKLQSLFGEVRDTVRFRNRFFLVSTPRIYGKID